ncbi:hypothetical protein G6F37_000519 [Rhizopus arrhizus]|nr:hypothetical protein G6F38_000599 [Rhizopus arrhizus]KAG1164193.1 hypothetical protein G6F37_000519 [Rhizopus arrhizus]
MLQNIRIMTAQCCSRRSLYTSRSLFIEKTSNIQSVAEQLQLSPSTLSQALTHKSFKHGKVPNNERLQYLGRRSIEYFAVDLNKAKSAEELKTIIKQTLEPQHLGARFDALGLESNVQCTLPGGQISPSVKSQAVQALVGAVYHERGLNAAKEFVKKNIFV